MNVVAYSIIHEICVNVRRRRKKKRGVREREAGDEERIKRWRKRMKE